jgi:hypothetical protein
MLAQHSTPYLGCITKLFKIQGVVLLMEMLVLISMFPVKRRTPIPSAKNSSLLLVWRESNAANGSKVDTADICRTLCQSGLINRVLRAIVTIRHFASVLKAALGIRDCSQIRFSRTISDYHRNFKRCCIFGRLATDLAFILVLNSAGMMPLQV